ncbi:MAG: 50S ribosomal protein L24 [Thioalkalivibrionaceae bacterium]
MKKIRSGDEVIVITGRDRGRRGQVVRILPNDRVVVQNVNMVKKHQRPNPQAGVAGGIIEKESSIHVSNVMVVDPSVNKGSRIGFKTLEDGRKVRVYRVSGEVVEA